MILSCPHLSPNQAAHVHRLAVTSASADGVAPLSEQTLLWLGSPAAEVQHLMTYAGDLLLGYAQLAVGGTAEMVVEPGARRRGVGSQLWGALSRLVPTVRVWAHGTLPGAVGLARAHHLVVVRELHKMARPLTEADAQAPCLPPGFSVREFVPGQDESAWLETNAAAFSHHPEQGRLGLPDLQERMQQRWFDPAGFLLVQDDAAPGRIAAFHWTKVDAGQRSSLDPASPAGEVYVLGVHPAYQGTGLAGPLTGLGLAHLAGLGLPEVVLYVDGDNTAALRTYARACFRSIMVDTMYSRPVEQGLSG